MEEGNRKQYSEADVVCELYHQWRLKGITPKMEYKLEDKLGRADLAFLKGNKLLLIVEVKNRNKDYPTILYTKDTNIEGPNYPGAQIYKYLLTGVPVLKMCNMSAIEESVKIIITQLELLEYYKEVTINKPKKKVVVDITDKYYY